MKTFKSTCSGILIVPDLGLRVAPGESFTCDQVSKEVAAAVANGLLVAVAADEYGDAEGRGG